MRIEFFLITLFAVSKCERFKNYYQGVEVPGLSKANGNSPKEQIFVQKLDHFDPADVNTWHQKYWENTMEYRKGGPAFLLINGEAPALPTWMSTGSWLAYGKELNPIYFLLEHRFYGTSHPTKNTSTENLTYLNSQQALADTAHFIEAMNKKHDLPGDTKWIVFGGSYAGSLAAWLRMKYPHLVYGAVSSSGPLLAKLDFHEYFQVVQRSVSAYTSKCESEIARANKQLHLMVKTKRGRLFVTEWFKLCDELTDDETDISLFFLTLAYNFANLVQYDKSYKNGSGLNTIRGVCTVLIGGHLGNKTSSVRRYAEVSKKLLNVSDDDCMSASYEDYIEKLREVDWETSNTYGRQWFYQTCTEFGFYQTSSAENDTFGSHLPIDFFTKQCQDIFGDKFDGTLIEKGVNRTNLMFGALDINTDRIIYSHGSVDPWYPLGFYDDKRSSNATNFDVVFIKGTSHCADLNEPTDKDGIDLKNARRTIRKIIHSWVKNS